MRKLLILLMVIMTVASVIPAVAGPPNPPDGVREIQLATAMGCEHGTWGVDPDTAGPLSANSMAAVVLASFCDETNTGYITVGSSWAGYQGRAQHVWGAVTITDSTGAAAPGSPVPFDSQNVPDVSGALAIPLTWVGPHDSGIYHFSVEINVKMLPENTGPFAVRALWTWVMNPYRTFLPAFYNSGPCSGFRIRLATTGMLESFTFKSPGLSEAEHRFGHSQPVTFTWRDNAGNLAASLPPGALIQLTWSDGYLDLPLSATTVLSATKWRLEGGSPPWLATSHNLTFQFSAGNAGYCRVTVPMIWDP